jgi:hypothetical protein
MCVSPAPRRRIQRKQQAPTTRRTEKNFARTISRRKTTYRESADEIGVSLAFEFLFFQEPRARTSSFARIFVDALASTPPDLPCE